VNEIAGKYSDEGKGLKSFRSMTLETLNEKRKYVEKLMVDTLRIIDLCIESGETAHKEEIDYEKDALEIIQHAITAFNADISPRTQDDDQVASSGSSGWSIFSKKQS
jgi:hypothetical protein